MKCSIRLLRHTSTVHVRIYEGHQLKGNIAIDGG